MDMLEQAERRFNGYAHIKCIQGDVGNLQMDDGLHSYFYTITVSYDGFDPNEKTEFYSMEDECEKIEQEIKKKYCGRIKAVEGDKQ